MLLFKWLKTPSDYIRKEALSTSLLRACDANSNEKKEYDPKDRTKVISLETGLRYMKSEAYKKAYGDEPVWTHYARNVKGRTQFKTRLSCISYGVIRTGSPCPICRDEYLVVHYQNVDLLKQFISPHGGYIYSSLKLGICQRQYHLLVAEIEKAKDRGLLVFEVPPRPYHYDLYKSEFEKKAN